jgi:hypothetical protein
MEMGPKIKITVAVTIIINACILKREILWIRDGWIISPDKC